MPRFPTFYNRQKLAKSVGVSQPRLRRSLKHYGSTLERLRGNPSLRATAPVRHIQAQSLGYKDNSALPGFKWVTYDVSHKEPGDRAF